MENNMESTTHQQSELIERRKRLIEKASQLPPEDQEALCRFVRLLKKYGSVEEMANHVDEFEPEERQQFLEYLDLRKRLRPEEEDHHGI
jgi:hypothetical protein